MHKYQNNTVFRKIKSKTELKTKLFNPNNVLQTNQNKNKKNILMKIKKAQDIKIKNIRKRI